MACAMISLAAGAGLGGYNGLFVSVLYHNGTYCMLECTEETFIFSSYSKEICTCISIHIVCDQLNIASIYTVVSIYNY